MSIHQIEKIEEVAEKSLNDTPPKPDKFVSLFAIKTKIECWQKYCCTNFLKSYSCNML